MLATALVAVFVSPFVSRDYWDWGLSGLAVTMVVGWLIVAIANALGHRRQPLLVALFAVSPWALGLAGMSFLGYLLVPAEAITTGLVLRRCYRDLPLASRRAFGVAVLARGVACLPLVC